jgi:UDP-glucose 4-epimerase
MKILVTGAAGYIGSVVTELLIGEGHEIVGLDDLSGGHRGAVHPAAKFVEMDLLDGAGLKTLFAAEKFDAVVHLAAKALIDESIRNPGIFFHVNITGGINLLEAMVANDVKRIVFSSTAATYGQPEQIPIVEDAPKNPVNAYGESKLAFERIMAWYRRSYGLCHVSLRYFNAAGATEERGEWHVPETHLIPIVFEAALGERESMKLFGTDWETRDGTCVRDYVHVVDIAGAHLLALGQIDTLGARAYNLGHGSGYSNLEVIEAVRKVTGREVKVVPAERRAGDPATLIASSELIRRELGWNPKYPDLETIIDTAWRWRQKHPRGYTE